MPGFFLFNAATGELMSIGPSASGFADKHRHQWRHRISDHHGRTFGLILPRVLFELLLPSPA
jgi:hypothetical protein